MSNKHTIFQTQWLIDPQFKSWLSYVDNDVHSARCLKCLKNFNLSNMGRQALMSHMNSNKHKKNMHPGIGIPSMDLFLSKHPSPRSIIDASTEVICSDNVTTSAISFSTSVSTPMITTFSDTPITTRGLHSYLLKDDITKAEILWSIETIMGHASSRLAGRNVKLFSVMFPDSQIASKMQLQRDKIGYLILFGIAPYFKNLLIKELKECDFLTVGFDESLNKVTQKEQMDLNVRYWSKNMNEVKTRYLTSMFLERSTAIHLVSAFLEAMSPLDTKKIIEISMDGPNVNFEFLKDLKKHMKEDPSDPELLEMGSCGLHTMHCAFKSGIQETGWNIIVFLRALYNLFQNVPARRQSYFECTGSVLFPLKFCSVRWLNNSIVAQRALDMLPHLLCYIQKMKVNPNQAPKCESFKTIVDLCKDPLLPVKLTFFKSLADDIEPFLAEFQTDIPLAPFLYSAITGIMRDQMERIVKPVIMKKVSSVQNIDMSDENNLLNVSEIELGIATKVALRKIKKLKDIDILQFRLQCKNSLKKLNIKLQERSPLAYKLTKAITCLDPSVVRNWKVAEKRLNNLLTLLVEKNRFDSTSAEKATREFKRICTIPAVQESLKAYSTKTQRIDHFWYKIFKDFKPSDNILTVLKLVTTLSHGNASVERGFSINKECLIENMKEETLIAKRCVYDAVTMLGGIENLKITKEIIHSARNAHGRFKEAAEKRRKEKETEVSTLNKKRVANLQIKELEQKKAKILEQVDALNEEIDTLKKE